MDQNKKEQAIKQALASLSMDQIYLNPEFIRNYKKRTLYIPSNKKLTLKLRRKNNDNK